MPSRRDCAKRRPGYRPDARILKEEFYRAGPVQRLLLRYTQALITQMAQTVVMDQQMCRWLLLCVVRLPLNEQKMTHELIANMLGVLRPGMTKAAMKLLDPELIRCSGDHIEVLEFDRLLTDVQAI